MSKLLRQRGRRQAQACERVLASGKDEVQVRRTIFSILGLPLIALIKIYQWVISPMIGPRCRFTPSCSQYAVEALKKHGLFKGFWLSLRRIARCHPWGGHGVDPVP